MTICTKCVHYFNTHEGGRTGPPADSWFYQKCTHPELERAREVNPVTGQRGYVHENDQGRKVYTDSAYPKCRDVNEGNCERYADAKKETKQDG